MKNLLTTLSITLMSLTLFGQTDFEKWIMEEINIHRESMSLAPATFDYTAYKIASQRPKAPIYVFTSNKQILTQLNLIWGVKGMYYNKRISTDHSIADIKHILKTEGLVKPGDLVINIASIPIEESGKSNMLKLSTVD